MSGTEVLYKTVPAVGQAGTSRDGLASRLGTAETRAMKTEKMKSILGRLASEMLESVLSELMVNG